MLMSVLGVKNKRNPDNFHPAVEVHKIQRALKLWFYYVDKADVTSD